MTLDKIVNEPEYILHLAQEDRLNEVPPTKLENHANLLVSYAIEKETRPELVTQLTSGRILLEYLHLSDKEKQKLEGFRRRWSDWPHSRKGTSFAGYKAGYKDSLDLLRKQRCVNQVVFSFDSYLNNREPFEVFTTNSLRKTEMGANVYTNAVNNFEGGFKEILDLATAERPKILEYMTFARVLDKDAPIELVKLFDYFLKTRKPYDVFNIGYIQDSKRGKAMYDAALRHCKGGFEKIFNLASQQRLEMNNYRDSAIVFKRDATQEMINLFSRFMTRRKPFEVFDTRVVKKSGKVRIYQKAVRVLKGGFDELIENACNEEPAMRDYIDEGSVFHLDAPKEMMRIFDNFMKRRKPYEVFQAEIARKTRERKDLYKGARSYLSGGYDALCALAAEERPKILTYSNPKEVFKIDAVPELLAIFNKFMKLHKGKEKFNTGYLHRTDKGIRLYHASERWLDGGIQELVQIAAQQRPSIRKYWSYQPRGKNAS